MRSEAISEAERLGDDFKRVAAGDPKDRRTSAREECESSEWRAASEKSEAKKGGAMTGASGDFVILSDPEVSDAAIEYFETVIFDGFDCPAFYWIAGGCLRTWLREKKIPKTCDVDVWFASAEGVELFRKSAKAAEWTETKETETSVNFRTKGGFWVQAIKGHFFEGARETIEAFDFTVCAFALDLDTRHFYHHKDSLLDMALGRLKIIDLKFPKSTLLRAFKYRDKGFRICGNQLETILEAIVEDEIEKRAAVDEMDPETEAAPGREYPWRGLD